MYVMYVCWMSSETGMIHHVTYICDSKRAFVRASKDWQGCASVALRAHDMYSPDLSGMCADSAFVSLHHCCPDLVCGWRFSWRNKLGIGHVYNNEKRDPDVSCSLATTHP